MGAGIHSVLEERDSNGTYHLVMKDVLQYMSSEIRSVIHELVSEEFTSGLPLSVTALQDRMKEMGGEGSDRTSEYYYGTSYGGPHWLGEYGHAHINLDALLKIKTNEVQNFSVEQEDGVFTIRIGRNQEDWGPERDQLVKELQGGISRMFAYPANFRLIVGFDS